MVSFPGTPMALYGDEIGLRGTNGENGRRPFPRERPEAWDAQTLRAYGDLIALRKSSTALSAGGLRWVHTGEDVVVFLRESRDETMLVLLSRSPGRDLVLEAGCLGSFGGAHNRYGGGDMICKDGKIVLPGDGPTVQIRQLL
jgi:alpha-glucosidase